MKTDTRKYWLISFSIPFLFYVFWFLFRKFESPFSIIFIILFPLLNFFALGWIILLLIKIRKIKLLLVPLILISLIPFFDTIFNIRLLFEDYFKPKKVLVARMNGPIAGRELNLYFGKTFEYVESSWSGTKWFKGEYTFKNDTLILLFNNSSPLVYGHKPTSWKINKKEKKVEITTDNNQIFTMDLIKSKTY